MKKLFPFASFKLRGALLILLGVTLILGIFLGNQQGVSWAAPEQHPDQQTVPPRPPTPDPNPPPEPPAPAPQPPPSSDDDDDDDDDELPPPPPAPTEEIPSPTPTPEPTEEVPPPTLEPTVESSVPTPTLESEDNNQVQSAQPLGPEEDDDQAEMPAEPAASGEDKDSGLAMPQEADLSLNKTVDNPRPEVSDEVSFTITVQNDGPGNATNIAVNNPLPAGLNLISVIPGQGKFNQATGLWTISAISPDQSVILNVVAKVTRVDSMANTAEIIAVDQFDPDSTPGNGLESEDDQDSAPLEISLETISVAQHDNSLPTQSDDETVTTSVSDSTSTPEPLLNTFGGLNWLYALGLGLLLILGGVFLTNRS